MLLFIHFFGPPVAAAFILFGLISQTACDKLLRFLFILRK